MKADIMDVYTTNENLEKYNVALDIHIKSHRTTNQNSNQYKFHNIELMNKAQFLWHLIMVLLVGILNVGKNHL